MDKCEKVGRDVDVGQGGFQFRHGLDRLFLITLPCIEVREPDIVRPTISDVNRPLDLDTGLVDQSFLKQSKSETEVTVWEGSVHIQCLTVFFDGVVVTPRIIKWPPLMLGDADRKRVEIQGPAI